MSRRWPFGTGLAVVGVVVNSIIPAIAAGTATVTDPPVLVPWSRVGDIALGESRARVEGEYGGVGSGFHLIQRYGNSVQGYYRLHGTQVIVTFRGALVNDIDFVTPYYRTASGFGIGSFIPLGPCHSVATGCEHRWRGFVFHRKWKDSPCSCWVKIGLGRVSLPPRGSFNRPWFFIFTHHGRAAEFYFARRYTD